VLLDIFNQTQDKTSVMTALQDSFNPKTLQHLVFPAYQEVIKMNGVNFLVQNVARITLLVQLNKRIVNNVLLGGQHYTILVLHLVKCARPVNLGLWPIVKCARPVNIEVMTTLRM
jgi:hypothetical protein